LVDCESFPNHRSSTIRGIGMDDNKKKALELVEKATLRHIRPAGVHFMPGFREMELNTEVKLHQWRVTMHKGLYFVADADSDMPGSVKRYQNDPSEGLVLYTASVSATEEELKGLVTDYEVTEEVDNQGNKDQAVSIRGTKEQAQKLGLSFEMKPVTVSDGHKVTMNELGVWLAIKDAKDTKDEAALECIHEAMFERLAPEPTEEQPAPPSINPINHALSTMPIDHSFALKVLQGIEQIAYSGKGQYELASRKAGSKERTVLNIAPDKCSNYIAHANANWELCGRIVATVHKLLKQPKAIAKSNGGRAWITTATIIKELTRTAKGTNSKLPTNDEFKKTVDDALAVLSNAQIEAFNAKGERIFLGSVFHCEYLKKIKDEAGNIIGGAWSFDTTNEGTAWAVFAEQGTSNTALLDIPPLKATSAWMPQFIDGTIMSTLRAKLYPAHGKGLKQFTYKASWNSIFDSADVKADGNIRPDVKKRIVKDFEAILMARAKTLAKEEDKPIWLHAKSTRDGSKGRGKGAWETLEVTGFRTMRKLEIDLQG
jgi:hypothetical protein